MSLGESHFEFILAVNDLWAAAVHDLKDARKIYEESMEAKYQELISNQTDPRNIDSKSQLAFTKPIA